MRRDYYGEYEKQAAEGAVKAAVIGLCGECAYGNGF